MDFLRALVTKGLLQEDDIASIQQEAEQLGTTVESVLIKRGMDPAAILEVKSEALRIPSRTLESASVPFEVLNYVPEDSARHYHFAPLGIKDNVLEVGITNPDNLEAIDALNFISSKNNIPYKLQTIS